MTRLRCGNGRRQVGQRGIAVDVVKADGQATLNAKVDHLSRHVRREGLALFVVADIALRAANSGSQRLLRQTQAFSDGLEVVHQRIISPTNS